MKPTNKVMPTIEQASNALFDTQRVLADLNIQFMLDGGTLLGFWRDGIFAADDHDDIDLTLHFGYWGQAYDIMREMVEAGFEVYHMWPRDERRHYSGQLAFKRENVKVDMMFKEFKPESGKAWWTIYGGPAGVTYKAVPARLLAKAELYPLKVKLGENKVCELVVGRPLLVEEYLAYRYGEWQTPVHRSEYICYKTDQCIVKPNNYESI